MTVVEFPTKGRVLKRLGLDFADRMASLDAEIRRIDAGMAALRLAKSALLAEYRKEATRAARSLSVALLSASLVLLSPCGEGLNQPGCGLALFVAQTADLIGQGPCAGVVNRAPEQIAGADPQRRG